MSSGTLVGSSKKVVGNEKVKERRCQSTEEVVHKIVEFIFGVQRQCEELERARKRLY